MNAHVPGKAEPAELPDWIAHTELQAIAPGGEPHSLYLAVSRPSPNADGGWEVRLRMAPLVGALVPIVGEDGWQAMNLALAFAEQQLCDLIAGGWTLHLQDDPSDAPALTPQDLAAMWGRAPT